MSTFVSAHTFFVPRKAGLIATRSLGWVNTDAIDFSVPSTPLMGTVVVCGFPYILCNEMEVASLFNTWLACGCEQKIFRLCSSWCRGRLKETWTCCNDFVTKNIPKMVLCYHLPSSFRIIMFAFLSLKANSKFKEIFEETSFPTFSEKCWCQHFCWDLRRNCLEKMHGYPNFSSGIPVALAKIYFFRVVLTWHKNCCI